jgi:transposase
MVRWSARDKDIRGQVLEGRTDVQKQAPCFQPGAQAFGDTEDVGRQSTKVLSGELGVPRDHLDRWCQQFRLGGAEGLRKAGRPRKRAGAALDPLAKAQRTKDLDAARKYIDELEGKVGQQQVELDFFRQALQQVREVRRPSDGPGVTASTRSSKR